LQSHEIQNLQTYTQYKVTVQVFNPEGLGPETTILVMTDEGGEYTTPILLEQNSMQIPRIPHIINDACRIVLAPGNSNCQASRRWPQVNKSIDPTIFHISRNRKIPNITAYWHARQVTNTPPIPNPKKIPSCQKRKLYSISHIICNTRCRCSSVRNKFAFVCTFSFSPCLHANFHGSKATLRFAQPQNASTMQWSKQIKV